MIHIRPGRTAVFPKLRDCSPLRREAQALINNFEYQSTPFPHPSCSEAEHITGSPYQALLQ